MDFLRFLRENFGGGQKSSAPSEQIPAMIRRPTPQQADREDAAPVGVPWKMPAPAPKSAMSFMTGPAPMPPDARPREGRPAENWQGRPGYMVSPMGKPAPLPEKVFSNGQANWMVPPTPEAKDQLGDRKQKAEDDAAAAERRSNFFGDEGEYAAEQMSVDKYLALSPRQRAVVDANTALIAAAEQDTASWAKQQMAGKPNWDQGYLNQVKETFGEEGGSDTYAPRTMAVLKDLGLDLKGKDLDQYLNYSALVTADDLNALPTVQPGAAPEDARLQNAVAFSQAATTRLSQTLAVGQSLLDSLRKAPEGQKLFGPATPAVGFTDGGSARDAELAEAFDVFGQVRAQADLTPERLSKVYAELERNHGVTPNEVAQYFETRLQAKEYEGEALGQPVTLQEPGTSWEYLTPKEFRAKFLKRGDQ